MDKGPRLASFRPPSHRAGWRYERLALALASLTAAVTIGVQASGKFTEAPRSLFLALYVAAAVLAAVSAWVKFRSTGASEDRAWGKQVMQLLAVYPTKDGSLPRLSSTNPYRLGVSPSAYGNHEQRGADPYIRRAKTDDELDHVLREKPFVLIVGDSKAGKSRTAYEAAKRLTRNSQEYDPKILVPQGTKSIGPLLDLDPPLDLTPSPTVLWLDDLTEGELEQLTPGLLERLRQQQVLIIGTMTVQRYGRINADASDVQPAVRIALDRATVVRLVTTLTEAEEKEARTAYPNETFNVGIGEQLVAAPKLADRYLNARQGAEPHGWAVLQAAIDWTRMDVGRPIRRSELTTLYPIYLKLLRPTLEPSEDILEHLRWACTPVGSHVALLSPATVPDAETAYLPFDYIVALVDGQDGGNVDAIPEATWNQLPQLATPGECYRASASAYYRKLVPEAQALLASVAMSGDSQAAPAAKVFLGVLLAQQGNYGRAKDLYQEAISTGHPEHAPTAMLNLGLLFEKQGDIQGAEDAYRQAIRTGHPQQAPRASNNLGLMLSRMGKAQEAHELYLQALSGGHEDASLVAIYNLGLLFTEQGEVEKAKNLYDLAVDANHPEVTPTAAYNLGVLLERLDDPQGARAAYEKALSFEHPASPMAAVNLGLLLERLNDPQGACAAYRRAIASDHKEQVSKALNNLGVLLYKLGMVDESWAAFQQAINTGHPDQAPMAMMNMGTLLEKRRDLHGAEAAYQQAIQSGHPEQAPKAARSLSLLRYKLGEIDG